MINVIQLFEPI